MNIRRAKEDWSSIVAIDNQAITGGFCSAANGLISIASLRNWLEQHLAAADPVPALSQKSRAAGRNRLDPFRPGRQPLKQLIEAIPLSIRRCAATARDKICWQKSNGARERSPAPLLVRNSAQNQ